LRNFLDRLGNRKSVVLAAATSAAIFACAAPTLDSEAHVGGGSDAVAAKKAPKKASSTTTDDSSTTTDDPPTTVTTDDLPDPDPAGVDGGASKAPAADPELTCMLQCIAGDPEAKAMMATYDRCIAKCAHDDTACPNACEQSVLPACEAHPASCAKLDTCEAKCERASTSAPPTTSPGPSPTYSDIAPLIAKACGGCHDGVYSTLDKVRTQRSAMISAISGGTMPKDQPSWAQTSDGQAVLQFLQDSP
jgi:hypothetical protein